MSDATAPVSTAPAPSPAPPVAPTVTGELTSAQAATMAQWTKEDLAKGKITAEQADKIFTQLNIPLEQRAPDARSAEEKLLDKAFPPASPSQYQIRYGRPGEDVPMTPELKAFDANARGWMASAGVPKEIGNSLVSTIAKITERTAKMTPDQLEQFAYDEYARLEKVHGPALEQRLNDAAVMIDHLEQKQPGLKQLLKSRGIGDSALVANLLIAHAQKYHARKQAQGR